MIAFTTREILLSVISAVIYGVIYSFFMLLCRLSSATFRGAFTVLFQAISPKGKIGEFDRIKMSKIIIESEKSKAKKEIFTAFSVILFFVGYIIVSYAVSDGVIRGYTLFLSATAFLLFSKYPIRFVECFTCYLLEKFFNLSCLVLRLVFRPFLLIFTKIVKIINKRAKKRVFLHKSST